MESWVLNLLLHLECQGPSFPSGRFNFKLPFPMFDFLKAGKQDDSEHLRLSSRRKVQSTEFDFRICCNEYSDQSRASSYRLCPVFPQWKGSALAH
ncbi:hypothetical protein B0H17DRAFT_1077517 [Mycena rosella]|uniref:Uncharacterized protein n=1 Tax=Mycena rosella TaxID=1033263 RepID=A0AAD7D5M2_MYCRO|nr:hypothetical protein B0H17DRAFT_1077517 [Mycena rosella]